MSNPNANAKAGIMTRDGLTANAKNLFLGFTPGTGGIRWQRRTTAGGATTSTTVAATIPSWVRLTRAGTTVTAYRSTDGVTWTNIGSQTITLSSTAYIGLGVTSNVSGTACKATFRNVTLTGSISRLP